MLSGASVCTAGPPEIAALMSITAASSEMSGSISSAASRAWFRLSATTTAIGSPTWLTLPSARIGCFGSFIGSPFLSVISQPQGMPPTPSRSAAVNTRSTPGAALAAVVSTPLMVPWATSERRK